MLQDDEEEKKKRYERARQLSSLVNPSTNISTNISSTGLNKNFNAIVLNNYEGNTDEEKEYIARFQRARQISNSINPRNNVPAPTTSDEDRIKGNQNVQPLLDLLDRNVDKNISKEEEEENKIINPNTIVEPEENSNNSFDGTLIKDKLFDNTSTDKEEPTEASKQMNNKNMIKQLRDMKGSSEEIKEPAMLATKENKTKENEINVLKQTNQDTKLSEETINHLATLPNSERQKQIAVFAGGDKEKIAEINTQVNPTVQAIEVQKETNKLNEDLNNNSYWSSIWHTIKSVPSNFIDFFITTIGAGETLRSGGDTNMASTAKLVSQKNEQINSGIENDIVRTFGNVALTIGDMLPSFLFNAIMPGSGRFISGINSGGQTVLNTVNDDFTNKGEAALSGLMAGAITYGTEGITGGNTLSGGFLDKVAKKYITQKTSSKFARKLMSKAYEVGGEILEEQVENHANYVVNKVLRDENITLDQYIEEFNETNKITFLTTVVLNLFGLGGNTYNEIINEEASLNLDNKTKESIKMAEKIIKDENLSLINMDEDVDLDKKIYTIMDTKIPNDLNENNIQNRLIQVVGKDIELKNKDLNIKPAVVRNNGYFDIIDSESGLKLDTSGYATEQEAIDGFNKKIKNIDKATINQVNNKVVENKINLVNMVNEIQTYADLYNEAINNTQNNQISENNMINNTVETSSQNQNREYTLAQYNDITKSINQISDKAIYNSTAANNVFDTVSNNIENVEVIEQSGNRYINSLDSEGKVAYQQKLSNRPYTGKKIKSIVNTAIQNADTTSLYQETNIDNTQESQKPNASNFYNTEGNGYAVQDIESVITPFDSQESYSKDELADVWNDKVSNNNYDAYYDENGNIERYIAIEEEGNNIVVNQYDNNDNIVKSEVIPSEKGRYNAQDIQNTISRVASLYDENRPIKGQRDIEGNEVSSMKKNKKETNNTKTTKNKNTKQNKYKYNNYSQKEMEDLSSNKIRIVKKESDISSFVKNAKLISSNIKLYFGKINNKIADIIDKKLGINVHNYNISLKNDDIRKIFKDHGTEKTEIPRGQVPITENDFLNIPEIINNPDNIERSGTTQQGKPAIKFEKNINGNNVVIVYVSDKHNNLEMQTMYKFKNNKNNRSSSSTVLHNNKNSGLNTSETGSGTNTPNKSISQNNQSVKNNTNTKDDGVRAMKNTSRNTSQTTAVDNQGRTLTKQQQEYFKDSKVRNSKGNLQTVYHTSKNDFTIFDPTKTEHYRFGKNNVNYYTDNKNMSLSYSLENPKLYEGYLNITNPYIINAHGAEWNKVNKTFDRMLIDKINKINPSLKQEIVNKAQETSKVREDLWNNYQNETDKLYALKRELLDEKVYGSLDEVEEKINKKPVSQRSNNEKEYLKVMRRTEQLYSNYNDYDGKAEFYKYFENNKEFDTFINSLNYKQRNDIKTISRDEFYEMAELGFNTQNIIDRFEYYETTNDIVFDVLEKNKTRKQKYDGVIIKNVVDYGNYSTYDGDGNVFVAFNSNQFKNVTNTTPTSNNDIRYMRKNVSKSNTTNNKSMQNTVNNAQEQKKIQKELHNRIANALLSKNTKKNTYLGQVTEKVAKKVKSLLGIDISGRRHMLSDRDIRHMINQHGNPEIEKSKGQVAITKKDIEKIPDIINNYDEIVKGSQNKNRFTKEMQNSIRYIKQYDDNILYVVEVVPDNSRQLEVKTMWKQQNNTNKKNNPVSVGHDNNIIPPDTSKTKPNSDYSTNSITQNTSNVKNSNVQFAKKSAKTPKVEGDILEPGQTNAQRSSNYIEQEIRKIEQTGNWDDSIPVTRMTDIRKTIENYLGIGVQKGHFRQQAYGIYKGNRDVIRTKELKDMDTILHETGHALDIGKRIKLDKESISNELLKAVNRYGGYEAETREVKLEEGFAEVIREYTIVPEQARIDYPQTVAVLEGIRQTDKDFNNFITTVQQQTYNYIHQNPRNRGGLSNQSIGERTDKPVWSKEYIKQVAIENAFDSNYALKRATQVLKEKSGNKELRASDNAYVITRLISGIGDKVTSILSDGYIDENGNKLFTGLNQLGEILNNDTERFNDLRAYLVAKRHMDYVSKDLKTGIRTNDARAIIEQFKNDTQIQEASKVVYDTLDGVLQYAVNNKLITEENAQALRESNAFYVPMQRVIGTNGNNVGRKGAVADIIKSRTGSELDIKDVLENIVANSSNIIQQVENNKVLNALYTQGENAGLTGAVYDEISPPMKKVGVARLSVWENELKNQGVDIENIDFDKTMDIFIPNNNIDERNQIVSFIDNKGQRRYLQFHDEILFKELTGLDRESVSKVLTFCNNLNKPLRYGATLANLGFALPNMLSDTVQAYIYSEAGFIPFIDTALGAIDVLTGQSKMFRNFISKVAPEYAERVNTMYELYQQSGATSATKIGQERKSAQNIMKDIYGTKNSKVLGIDDKMAPLKRLLDIMTYIPELSEQSTRFRVFEKNLEYYRKNGMSEIDARMEAALQSRDATQDFSRMGKTMREVNKVIPFSAARVGSIYTFAEKMKANPKRTSARIAVMLALNALIKGLTADDDEINELNQRKKDDNFVFKIGDQVITIKKPQGFLRSLINLNDYIIDLANGNIEEGKEGERLQTWLLNAIMDNSIADDITGMVPSAITPLLENAINKDLYYNSEIVKSYDLELPDSEQYYDYNSQLAIWLGSIFNYSPAKIDNFISGYFAGLGTQVTNIIDWIVGKTGATPEEPNMGLEANSIGKRFFVNVNSNSQSVDDVYTLKTDLTKKKNGGTITSEETEQLEAITEATSNMAKVNKQIKEIKKSMTMSADEKAEQIKELQKQKTDIARNALGKDLIYSSSEEAIESIGFYPSRDTLSKNKQTLTMTSEMKKEYEEVANEYYQKYERQGIYSEEKLEQIKTKAKDYAKNYMMKKYKSKLTKSD